MGVHAQITAGGSLSRYCRVASPRPVPASRRAQATVAALITAYGLSGPMYTSGVQEVGMQVGVAEARRRFKEMLDRVAHGEIVSITRRETIIAVLGPPSSQTPDKPLGEALRAWRLEWDVDSWPDDDPFAGVRDGSGGRESPW